MWPTQLVMAANNTSILTHNFSRRRLFVLANHQQPKVEKSGEKCVAQNRKARGIEDKRKQLAHRASGIVASAVWQGGINSSCCVCVWGGDGTDPGVGL